MQHSILYQLFGEKLFFPEIFNPTSVLECGYGSGDWVVQIADEYEDCEVCQHGYQGGFPFSGGLWMKMTQQLDLMMTGNWTRHIPK